MKEKTFLAWVKENDKEYLEKIVQEEKDMCRYRWQSEVVNSYNRSLYTLEFSKYLSDTKIDFVINFVTDFIRDNLINLDDIWLCIRLGLKAGCTFSAIQRLIEKASKRKLPFRRAFLKDLEQEPYNTPNKWIAWGAMMI